MIKRLKILTSLQFSNITNIKLSNARDWTKIALRALLVILITIGVSFILYLINNVLYIAVNAYFLIFMLLLIQIFSISITTISLMNSLYDSKENQILLSYPVNNHDILASKLIVYYIKEFIKNLYLILPFFIGVGFVNKLPYYFYFNMIIVLVLLPLISVAISALLSIPVTLIKSFLKKHSILQIIFLLLIISGLFILVIYSVRAIPRPIRIIQLYNRFVINIGLFMQTISKYASIYTVIGQLLYGVKLGINYPIMLATPIVLIGLVYLIGRPLYFLLASKTSEEASLNKHKTNKGGEKNLFWTFLKKELLISSRTPQETLSHYSLLLALPFIMFTINSLYMGMNRNSQGNMFVLVFNVLIVLMVVTASNTASATAISSEGYEFVLLKTAPSETKTIAWSKITFNIAASTVMILISFIIFQITMPLFPVMNTWLLFLLVILINISHILWSFQIDLLNPQLNQYATLGTLNNSPNVSKSIGIGFSLSLIFGIVALISFLALKDLGWIVLYIMASALMIIRFMYFRSYLSAYFIDIEL